MARSRLRGRLAALVVTPLLALTILAACGDEATETPAAEAATAIPLLPAPTAASPTTGLANPAATTTPILAPTATSRPPTVTAVSATAAPTPAATPVPTAAVETPTRTPSPTPTPTATAAPVSPTPEATPEPSPPPMLQNVFDDFGFFLGIERGARVRATANATAQQGALSFAYGGVNVVMTWTPQEEAGLLQLVSGTYDLLQNNQQSLTFETIIDGQITVEGEPGLFLGFKAVDASRAAGGGLIGSWTCRSSGTSFTLTLTGTDTVLVQIRFDELINNFRCFS